MKNIFILLFCITPSFAAQICGPTVSTFEYSYTVENPSGTIAGYWAVGAACANGEFVGDIITSCEHVIVTGRANCEFQNTSGNISGKLGAECHCRRLKLLQNGQLVDNTANQYTKIMEMDIETGVDPTLCMANCARLCAEEVAHNTYGYRNMIMIVK